MNFLCSLPKTATRGSCAQSFLNPSDLNIPSITLTALFGSRLVRRTVMNVARKTETYLCAVIAPKGVIVDLNPKWFTIAPKSTQDLVVSFNVTEVHDEYVISFYKFQE